MEGMVLHEFTGTVGIHSNELRMLVSSDVRLLTKGVQSLGWVSKQQENSKSASLHKVLIICFFIRYTYLLEVHHPKLILKLKQQTRMPHQRQDDQAWWTQEPKPQN
jgi:hypothetical protein